MSFDFYFDPDSVEQSTQRVSEGPNNGVIVDAVKKQTRDRRGAFVEIAVAFGDLKILARCNIENASPIAVQIGMETLKKVYLAAGSGKGNIRSLIGKNVMVHLEKKKGIDGKMYLEITDWIAKSAKPLQQAQQAQHRPTHEFEDCPF